MSYSDRYHSHSPCGFTLIELSIVLVIIGLIVGGILVGRDLIHTAEIRATIKQVEDFNTAVNAFRTKYNCLPGDCASAASYGFGYTDQDGVSQTSNGNGDGVIGRPICILQWPPCDNMVVPSFQEAANFWYHLSAAGLIPYGFKGYYIANNVSFQDSTYAGLASPPVKMKPRNAFPAPPLGAAPLGWIIESNAMYGWAPLNGEIISPHSFLISALTHAGVVIGAGYIPEDMYAIDVKIDDGLPATGIARGWNRGQAINAYLYYEATKGVGGANSPVCVANNVSPEQYNIRYQGSDPEGLCSIMIKASF